MARLLLLVASVALLALAAAVPAAAHSAVHPLARVQVHNIQKKLDGGVISIDATILNGTGNTVTVSWSGMSSHYPGNQDWIGVWSPKPDDYTKTSPAKYKFVTPDTTGSGSTSFWLVNMRASYVVAYFTNGQAQPQLLAESAPVEFSNYEVPMHLHLALTNDPTQMRVNWNSVQVGFPSVQWGLSADNLNNTVIQVLTGTYTASDMCGAPATTVGWHEPGYQHSALLQGLPFNTKIYYQVGAESSASKSDVLYFWSPMDPASREAEFIIFGDLGQVETDGSNEASQMDGSILTTLAMAKDFADGSVRLDKSAAVFHIGDLSYARGYATIWEQFFYQLSPLSPYVPWMTVDGNHERDFPASGSAWSVEDSGGECGVAMTKRFSMPNNGKTNSTWWSLDFGPVHFAIISTELDFSKGSEQLDWLAKDLAAVDRTKMPFVILAGHRPMYIDSTNNSPNGGDLSVGALLIENVEPLLLQYQVDAAFWGHHHSMQRTCPVQNFTCVDQSKAPIHIVTGAAGAGFSTNLQSPQPKWIEFVEDNTHGYIRAKVAPNAASLTFDFISDNDRSVMDTVTILNKFAKHSEAKAPAARRQRRTEFVAQE